MGIIVSAPTQIRLQPTTPGTAQTGHANISGTITAATFATGNLTGSVNGQTVADVTAGALGKKFSALWGPQVLGFQQDGNGGSATAVANGDTQFVYGGRATENIAIAGTVSFLTEVITAAVAAITWAEVAVFKAAAGFPLHVNGSMTLLGYADVSATYNSTGRKLTTITLTAPIAVGDDLFFAYGSLAAVTPFQLLQCISSDDIQSGGAQVATVRPSLAASPQATTLLGLGVAFAAFYAK